MDKKHNGLSDAQREVLTQALTGGHETKMYRNFLASHPGENSWRICLDLVQKGLMVKHAESQVFPGLFYFHVTEEGAKSVGLTLKG